MVVLHFTAMRSLDDAIARLCDPAAEVSSHYLITARGDVLRLVPEERRAWHAGKGRWGRVVDVNSRSIGIELDNDGRSPFAAPLMDALEALLSEVLPRWNILPERVLGHSDCAPGRKLDPGPRFDWVRLGRSGLVPVLAADPAPDPGSDAAFVAAAAAGGYTASNDPDVLLQALRLRYRPWARGARDAVDMGLAQDLSRRFPVDPEGPAA